MRRLQKRRIDKNLNIEKASLASLILNLCEVFVLLLLLLWLLSGYKLESGLLRQLLCGVIVLLIAEGLLSARDALAWRETGRSYAMLQDAQKSLNELNLQLRKQRHDFINQLQVVYSLVDMDEKEEAIRYMEAIYGQMHALSAGLKTQQPAVNALLSAKLADCEQRHIRMDLQVETALRELPIDDWAFCRILGNLLDNAMEALENSENPAVTVHLKEDLRCITLTVSDNGPAIPPQDWKHIFSSGFTTKKTGQGLGLSIVRELAEQAGGTVSVSSDAVRTDFVCTLPKRNRKEEAEQAQ